MQKRYLPVYVKTMNTSLIYSITYGYICRQRGGSGIIAVDGGPGLLPPEAIPSRNACE